MANPYSKYTGQRVSAIPAGYLEANARAAASLQSGLASIGEAIGKYYGNKRKDEQESYDKQAVSEFLSLHSGDLPYGTQYKDDESGDVERIPDSKILTPIEAYNQNVSDTKSTFQGWMEKHGDSVSPEVLDKVQGIYFKDLSDHRSKYVSDENIAASKVAKKPTDPADWVVWTKMKGELESSGASQDEISDAFQRHFNIEGGAEASALSEKVAVVDKIAEAMGWDAEQTATAKARIVGALPSDSSVPASLQSLEAIKGMTWYKDATPEAQAQYDQMLLGVYKEQTALEEKSKYVNEVLKNAGLSPKEERSIKLALVNVNPEDTRSSAQIMLDELKQTEAWQGADEARRNEMTEQIFNVTKKQNDTEIKDSIISSLAENYGLSEDETKVLRLRGLGVDDGTSPQEKVLAGLKLTSAWKKATPERRAEMEQQVYSVEPTDNRDYQRDVKAGEAYIDALKAQGNVPNNIIDQMSKAKTLTAMKTIFQNMPDDSVLPAEVQTWKVIEESLKEKGATQEEINEYFKIHYGLEGRRDDIQTMKEFKAYEAILADPDLTNEQKSRAGVLFGYVTKEEQLFGAYERWENGEGKDATDVEKQRKARALGIIGPLDTRETLLDIKLKAARAKEDEKLAEAISRGEVDVLDIPGADGYKFVRASADQGYQLINTNTRSIVRDVTEDEAREWNKKLKDAGFPHQWHEAPSKSGGKTYELINPTGDPLNALMRQSLYGAGGGNTGGVVPVPKSQLSAEEQAIGVNETYTDKETGKRYRMTKGGRVEIQ
jgi:hypothetical protein